MPRDLSALLVEIDGLSPTDRTELARILNEATTSIFANAPDEAYFEVKHQQGHFCPACGRRAIKYGRVRGVQRYKCKSCETSYGDTTGTPLAHSRKPMSAWARYIACFIRGYSIPRSAREVGIAVSTAYAWRHRILQAIRAHEQNAPLTGIVEADETYLPDSYKGNHTRSTFSLPRDARKRGQENSVRGISNEQVSIVCMTDRSRHCYLDVACRGRINQRNLETVFSGRLARDAVLCTDKHPSYRAYARNHNVTLRQTLGGRSVKDIYHIQHINSLHSQLKRFLKRFSGVSTKHLDGYLHWFMWEQETSEMLEKAKQDRLMLLLITA